MRIRVCSRVRVQNPTFPFSDLLLNLLSFVLNLLLSMDSTDWGRFHFLLISFSFRSSSEWFSPFPFLHAS